jgi:hypothetical protein
MLLSFSAMAQKAVPYYEVEQCDTIEFSVVDIPGLPTDRYTWDLYRDSTVNFATEQGDVGPVPYFVNDMYQGSTVQVTGLEAGRYFLRVMIWNEEVCTNNLMVFMFDVTEHVPYAVLYADSVCYGEPTMLKVVFTGTGPWGAVVTYSDGTVALNLNGETENEVTRSIPPLPVGQTVFHIVQVSDKCTVNDQIVEKAVAHIYPRPRSSRIYVSEMIGP